MSTNVTLYGHAECHRCKLLKKIYEDKGLTVIYRDTREDAGAAEAVSSLGYSSVPVTVAGDEHWNGIRPDLMTTHLGIAS